MKLEPSRLAGDSSSKIIAAQGGLYVCGSVRTKRLMLRPDAGEYALILIVFTIVIGVPAVSQLSRYAPFELSTTRLRMPLPFKRNILLAITWTGVINWGIYGINGPVDRIRRRKIL